MAAQLHRWIWTGVMALSLAACARAPAVSVGPAPDVDWPFYGGDAGGQRYSSAAQVTPAAMSPHMHQQPLGVHHLADIGQQQLQ